MSIFDLSGRVAVITGGNGGIGLGIAQALAAAGCNVSIWGRNADKNKVAAASMAGAKGDVDTQICDVTSAASVKAAMDSTLRKFGRVDGCFANAGIGGGGRHAFIDRTEEQWRNMFVTNLDGVFHAFQAAARHMTERATNGDAFGRLVATSSLASLFGTARNEHYAATKAAINALVRALAVEQARYGITWGPIGAAIACLSEAVEYTKERMLFGRPVAATQSAQIKMADMARRITLAQMLVLQLGRLKDAGTMQPTQVSLAKWNNCRMAIDIARECRDILGGAGITTEHSPIRHALNLESVITYEGTETVHQLVVGREVTGINAF